MNVCQCEAVDILDLISKCLIDFFNGFFLVQVQSSPIRNSIFVLNISVPYFISQLIIWKIFDHL
jgi:hypothetical protein